MDSQKPINIKILSDLIKNLYIHKKFSFPQKLGSIIPNQFQLAILSVLNLQINESLDHSRLQPQNSPTYFERQTFVIGRKLRKVGDIVKIISSLCQFEDSREKDLASFETVNFYQSPSLINELPHAFLNFLKGIYPQINVHKDNIPLYMPFYDKLESYSQMIGNPNWEISRVNLDFIYRSEILAPSGKEDNWYLLLTGNSKILDIYSRNSIEHVWAYMYYFYVNSTLKPYRYITSKTQAAEEINFDKVIEVILEKVKTQTNKEVSHLLSLILYVLTDNTDQLENSFIPFQQEFQLLLTNSSVNPQSRRICSEWGLINSFYCQLLHNLLDNLAFQEIQDNLKFRELQYLLDQSIELTQALVQKAIPYHDFYLRISHSSYTKDGDKVKRSNERILQILKNALQKSTDDFPFPKYGYLQYSILGPFSRFYLQKYPQKIIQIVKYLPQETAIWKLLTCEKLNDFNEFQKISEYLKSNRVNFIQQIQRRIKISQKDYDEFLKVWRYFHDVVNGENLNQNLDFHLQKAKNCICALNDILTTHLNEEFRKRVYLPLSKSENILRITNVIIEGLDELLPVISEDQKQAILKEYLTFLLDSRIKEKIIGLLTEKDATSFWKKWSLVYMIDQELVNELIHQDQSFQQLNRDQGAQEQQKNILQNNVHHAMEIE